MKKSLDLTTLHSTAKYLIVNFQKDIILIKIFGAIFFFNQYEKIYSANESENVFI